MRKAYKGSRGYIAYQRVYKTLITAILFLIPIGAYIAAYLYFGTNRNIITVIALVGCLPACRSLVNLIMFFTIRPPAEEIVSRIAECEGSLTCAYELYLTTGDKNTLLDCVAICGNTVVGLCTFKDPDIAFAEKHIENVLRSAGQTSSVNIMKDPEKFIARLKDLNSKADRIRENCIFNPDDRHPGLTLEELIKYNIMAVAL